MEVKENSTTGELDRTVSSIGDDRHSEEQA